MPAKSDEEVRGDIVKVSFRIRYERVQKHALRSLMVSSYGKVRL